MVTIRERQSADLERLADVLRAVHKDSGYPVRGIENAVEFISNPLILRAWVAEREENVVGQVAIARSDSEATYVKLWRSQGNTTDAASLERLFVHPASRGLGIAPKLITTAVEYAQEQGVRLLLFNLKKDLTARRMYERLGWEFYGNFDFEYGNGQSMQAFCFVSPEVKA